MRVHAMLRAKHRDAQSGRPPPTCFLCIHADGGLFLQIWVFVVEIFFDRDHCSELRADQRAGIPSAATVGSDGAEFVIDRRIRRVNQVN
jgi:hypothetical protein